MADSMASYVGKTLAELLNRKDDLVTQLSQIEAQIVAASGRVGDQIKKLPSQLPGLRSKKTRRATARRPPRRAAKPAPEHAQDAATKAATIASRAASANDRATVSARPRTAPRASRRK